MRHLINAFLLTLVVIGCQSSNIAMFDKPSIIGVLGGRG